MARYIFQLVIVITGFRYVGCEREISHELVPVVCRLSNCLSMRAVAPTHIACLNGTNIVCILHEATIPYARGPLTQEFRA